MVAGKARKIDVSLHRDPEGLLDYVAFEVQTRDGTPLTGNQIIEAIAEAVLMKWDHCPIEEYKPEDFDA